MFTPESLKDAVVNVLDQNKAEDIVVVPLTEKSALADYMIIASGLNSRHVVALSEFIEQAVAGRKAPSRYEGKQNGDWVLADLGDVIVHIFRPEVRSFYNIEKIWVDDFESIMPPRRNVAENHIFQG